jgi:hypothetical protein
MKMIISFVHQNTNQPGCTENQEKIKPFQNKIIVNVKIVAK